MKALSRRDLLKTASLAGAAAAVPLAGPASAQSQNPQSSAARQPSQAAAETAPENLPERNVLFFFNQDEAKFVRAAVDRLIPADGKWGGAEEAGVLHFIDGQLASAFGAGARMYLKGPWKADATPQQGNQLKHSPAALYQIAISEVRAHVKAQHGNREFWELQPDEMDKVLSGLESGDIELPSIPSPVFFETLLAHTVEGYFSDPAYGGNRNMVSWRMIGFPGAYAQFVGLVDQHGFPFEREPLSIATSPLRLAGMHEHA
jgi:gluconate 2-dehydrogenase gamma chain